MPILTEDFEEMSLFGFIHDIFSFLKLVWKHRASFFPQNLHVQIIMLRCHLKFGPLGVPLWYLDFSQRSQAASSPKHVQPYAATMCMLKRRRYGDMLQRLIPERVSKLPRQYVAGLMPVVKPVLYTRYTNRSWPVKISEVSRGN